MKDHNSAPSWGSEAMNVELRRDLFAAERNDDLNVIGEPVLRQDIEGHVTGRSPFYDDHAFEGLLHIRCVRSPHHHARIRSIDTSAAERMQGVKRVVLGKDVPVNLNTLLSLLDFGLDDEPLLSTDMVRYKGEPVCAIIAESEAIARAACELVRVEWDVRPHVLDPEDALKPGAPSVNPAYPGNAFVYHGKFDRCKLRFGDPDSAIRQAHRVIEGRYQMSPIEQAPIETCGAIAAPDTNNRWVCYTSTQGLFFSLGVSAKVLDMSSARLHFIGGTVGGGFGGKVDSLHEPMAILGAMLTGRPVKYQFDRADEMQVGAPRGAERWYVTDAVDQNGRITARKFTGYFDAGAYTRLTSYAVMKCIGHLPGPYTIPNVSADVYCVYTNRTPATAMRGFGITGVDFAIESHMDRVATEIGMDPIELRILNSYRDGDMKAHRREAKNCALVESCQVAAEKSGWGMTAEMRAQSSMISSGEPWRSEIPAYTATDESGHVSGYEADSYAQKASANEARAQRHNEAPRAAPPAPPAYVSVSPPPAHAPTAPPTQTSKPSGTRRFSNSLSGLRRR